MPSQRSDWAIHGSGAVMQEMFGAGLSWRRPPVEKGRALPGSWRCAGDGLFSLRRQGAIPSQRLSAGRAVPVWQLLRMLYPATAIAVAMAATSPEGAHGGDSHAAELLTVQNGGMDSDTQPIPGLKLGNVATPHGDTFTFLGRMVLHLPAKTGKSLKKLEDFALRSSLAAN